MCGFAAFPAQKLSMTAPLQPCSCGWDRMQLMQFPTLALPAHTNSCSSSAAARTVWQAHLKRTNPAETPFVIGAFYVRAVWQNDWRSPGAHPPVPDCETHRGSSSACRRTAARVVVAATAATAATAAPGAAAPIWSYCQPVTTRPCRHRDTL